MTASVRYTLQQQTLFPAKPTPRPVTGTISTVGKRKSPRQSSGLESRPDPGL